MGLQDRTGPTGKYRDIGGLYTVVILKGRTVETVRDLVGERL